MARYQHKPKKNKSATRTKPTQPTSLSTPVWIEKIIDRLKKWSGRITLVLAFVLLAILNIYDGQGSNYDRTSAQVLAIKPLTEQKQSKEGSRTIVTGYRIEYKYVLDSRVYESEKTLPTDDQEFVQYLNKQSKENRKIEVLYRKDNNGESKINTKLSSDFYRSRQ